MSLGLQPRFPLAVLPTPLQEAQRLRAALGGPERCPRILIKRDDLTGLAFGGNKARKLEFLVADALKQQATVLVTCGAAQSNHARMTAAAACMAGLRSSLVLTGDPDQPVQGNLLLDYLLGAEVHFILPNEDKAIATGDEQDAMLAAVMEALQARGERPYLIPVGGSSPVGTLGYVAGTLELVGQLAAMGEEPGYLYYASGSRSTQAGLELGKRLFSAPYRLQGVAVSGGDPQKTEKATRIANEAAEILGSPVRLSPEDLRTDQGYIGEGYGIATPACQEALALLARQEGIFLDPTYTAKAMAGLIDHIRRGMIAPSETVIFLHTGGTPAIFAKVDQMSSLLNIPVSAGGYVRTTSSR